MQNRWIQVILFIEWRKFVHNYVHFLNEQIKIKNNNNKKKNGVSVCHRSPEQQTSGFYR